MAHARHRKCWGKSDELMRGYFNPTLHPLPCPSSFLTNIKMLQIHPCFPGGSDGKESACNAGDPGSIPGLGRSPAEGNGYPIQYSYLENSMDKRACWATVYWVTKSWTLLSNYHFHPYFKATTNIHSTLHLPPTTILTLWLQSSPLEKWSPLAHFTLTLCSFLRPGSRSWPHPPKPPINSWNKTQRTLPSSYAACLSCNINTTHLPSACMLSHFSRVHVHFVIPWAVALQAPPGKNTGVGCCALLQGIFPTRILNHISYVSCICMQFFTTSATWEAHLPFHLIFFLAHLHFYDSPTHGCPSLPFWQYLFCILQ